ncbi:hypothetical protein F441_14685, partial [Phytophthora nicotianae CJ01A1]
AVFCEKLQRLKQTANMETYNGKYSALTFRVEGMSVDLTPVYANGLKTRTRSYTKLEKLTLSDANNLAVKDEVTHFVEDIRDHHFHKENKRRSGNRSQEVE